TKKFHKIILGHFHVDLNHPHYWIGPSASGTDALDHKQGRRSEPKQAFWMVHPKKGEFNRNAFLLRD
ncbi:MAG: hypothetical protein KKE05_06265, partial [Nanoarchaeota archaeon]|nr:hypothetical protein [Nanoarchaeota archaeon]